jgi:hypothetical protein
MGAGLEPSGTRVEPAACVGPGRCCAGREFDGATERLLRGPKGPTDRADRAPLRSRSAPAPAGPERASSRYRKDAVRKTR